MYLGSNVTTFSGVLTRTLRVLSDVAFRTYAGVWRVARVDLVRRFCFARTVHAYVFTLMLSCLTCVNDSVTNFPLRQKLAVLS